MRGNLSCIKLIAFAVSIMIVLPNINIQAATKGYVVVYTAMDQVFAEPILKEFEQKTGIKVKAVYDVEATKTTGLVNRLIAEKRNPQCDVF